MTMKYSFEQFYVWYQYGLSLISDQKVLFLKELLFYNKKVINLFNKVSKSISNS